MRLSALLLLLSLANLAGPVSARDALFRRGDSNQDGKVDLSDATRTLGFLFLGTESVSCRDAADANDDGGVDIADPIHTLGFLFVGTAPPPAPFEECGADPSLDGLDCDTFAVCEQPPPAGEGLFGEPASYSVAAAITTDVALADLDGDGALDLVVRIRRSMSPDPCSPSNSVVTTIHTFGSGVSKVWGLALGDFNGAGAFGAYIVVEENGEREVRRLNPDNTVEFFAGLPAGNTARTIEFDPVSGDLFVSEDEVVDQGGGEEARIWRIDEMGVVRLFGKNFNKPNGITFFPTGVMLVAEEAPEADKGNVLVIGGWRNEFKRGDANGDGTVDLADSTAIFNWANQGGAPPQCFDGADANDDSFVNDADGNLIFEFLFSGGPQPCPPGPFECGKDPTRDLLDCITSDSACAIE